MSVACMNWVFQHSKASGNDRLLLLAIADVADDNGDNAWPSVATLARKATCSERTVQRRLQTLEEAGCITVIRGRGRGGTHLYRVHMDDHAAGRTSVPSPVHNMGTEGGEAADNPDQGVTTCHPVNVTGEVTQLRHPGGDTWVSPERPERPKYPPTPRKAGGKRRPSTPCDPTAPHPACRGCGTTDRQQRAAATRLAAALAPPAPRCPIHPTEPQTSCRGCAADRKAAS